MSTGVKQLDSAPLPLLSSSFCHCGEAGWPSKSMPVWNMERRPLNLQSLVRSGSSLLSELQLCVVTESACWSCAEPVFVVGSWRSNDEASYS